jgi:hypothetical protein
MIERKLSSGWIGGIAGSMAMLTPFSPAAHADTTKFDGKLDLMAINVSSPMTSPTVVMTRGATVFVPGGSFNLAQIQKCTKLRCPPPCGDDEQGDNDCQ